MIVPTPEAAEPETSAPARSNGPAVTYSASSPGFDDIVEAIGEPAPVRRRPSEPEPEADPDLISLPRRWLYFQAALFVLLGLACYLLGYAFSGRGTPSAELSASAPPDTIVVNVTLSYDSPDGNDAVDEGAIVVILPADKIPHFADRLPSGDFTPERAAPTEPSLQLLKAWGGAFGRADAKGEAQLVVGKADKYRVIAVSRHGQRPPKSKIDPADQAVLEKIFTDAAKLVGEHSYLVRRTDLFNGSKFPYRFPNAK